MQVHWAKGSGCRQTRGPAGDGGKHEVQVERDQRRKCPRHEGGSAAHAGYQNRSCVS